MVIIIIVVNTMKSAVQLLLLFSLVIAAVSYRTSLSIHNRVTTQLQQQLLQPKSPQHRTNTAIKSYYDDEPKGLSPKILGEALSNQIGCNSFSLLLLIRIL